MKLTEEQRTIALRLMEKHRAVDGRIIMTATGFLECQGDFLAALPKPEAMEVMFENIETDEWHKKTFYTEAPIAQPASEQEPAWQPIETAPKDETPVLCYGKTFHPRGWSGWLPELDETHPEAYGWSVRRAYWLGGNWQSGSGYGFAPTHWMPLPDAPAIASVKGGTK